MQSNTRLLEAETGRMQAWAPRVLRPGLGPDALKNPLPSRSGLRMYLLGNSGSRPQHPPPQPRPTVQNGA